LANRSQVVGELLLNSPPTVAELYANSWRTFQQQFLFSATEGFRLSAYQLG